MTTKRPWMPLYIADYREDTEHLKAAQHGAYLLLIMEYWDKGGLPSDDEALRAIVRMTPKEWRASRSRCLAFFTLNSEGKLTHKRIDAELAKMRLKSLRLRDRAQKGAAAMWRNKHASSNASSIPQADAYSNATSYAHLIKKDKPYSGTISEQPPQMLQASETEAAKSNGSAPPPPLSDERGVGAPPHILPQPTKPIPVSESLMRIELARQLRRPISDAEFQRYLEQRNAQA